MRSASRLVVCLTVLTAAPAQVLAQRFQFERTFEVTAPATLDVSTTRGTIEVVAGEPGRIVVEGAATVRVGWNVPANAIELAKQVAARPPIDYSAPLMRLRDPADPAQQQAVIVNYRVRVPPQTDVRATSDSGATTIRGIAGTLEVRTQSAAIDISDLSGSSRITTGSGAVLAHDVAGALSVTTTSSGFKGSHLGSSLRIRTQSGGISAAMNGRGDVDVETGSSAIDLRGVRGALVVNTQSGRITVQGAPLGDWSANTGSSAVTFDVASTGLRIDASSRSGDVTLNGSRVSGATSKHEVAGTVGTGGPAVRVRTGSGAIHINYAAR